MILFYPLIIIDHEGIDEHYLAIFKLPHLIVKELRGYYYLTKIRLAMIKTREYFSRSGDHEVLPYNIRPIFIAKNYDLYAYEKLYEVFFKKKRFKTPEELFDVAYNMYISNAKNPIPKVSAFLWSVRKGWFSAMLVRPVSADELLSEIERFTLAYFFDIASML